MESNKPKKYPRNILKTSNKYQEKMILLTFIPSALIFLLFVFIVLIGDPIMSKIIAHAPYGDIEKIANEYSLFIVFLLCVLLLLSMIGAFIISNYMVGAFGRIIAELDEIIAGRSQRTIIGRPKDELTNDLLKRINVLVKNYIENRK